MKKMIYTLCILNLALCTLHSLPSFPGAEGYGANATGGRGGRIILVTNLNAGGPGSLMAALRSTGPRIIVFRVSGVIDLQPNRWYLDKANGNVTIAGQTSPGGITLTAGAGGSSIMFCYHCAMDNFIFRFLRFRAKAHNEDALTISDSYNYIIDHCDFSGGSDETLNLNYGYDFTVQWSTVANSSQGQTYGFLMAYPPTTRISLHHNLMAHHEQRFPVTHWNGDNRPTHALVDYRNNVCYDFGICGAFNIRADGVHMMFNVVGNYFKAGPANLTCSDNHGPIKFRPDTAPYSIYSKDNYWLRPNNPVNSDALIFSNTTDVAPNISSPHDSMPLVTTYPVLANYDSVLNKVGAWPRDQMNIRTVQDVRTGTGTMRKDDDPLITTGPQAPDDTDMDGMPDCWESTMGLNPNDPTDNNGDHDGDGYTNIEEYINDMAFAQLGEMPHNCMLKDGCPVAIEERVHGLSAKTGLSLSPNPYSAGTLFIKTGTKGVLQLLDVRGRLLYQTPISGNMAIPRSRLGSQYIAPGMVIVRVQGQDGRSFQKPLMILE